MYHCGSGYSYLYMGIEFSIYQDYRYQQVVGVYINNVGYAIFVANYFDNSQNNIK